MQFTATIDTDWFYLISDIPCFFFFGFLLHKLVDGGGRRSIMLHSALISGEGDDHVGRNWRRLAFTCTRVVLFGGFVFIA